MKWVTIIISIVFAMGFLFVATAVIAALFASAGDNMEDELNEKRQDSISKTSNKRK